MKIRGFELVNNPYSVFNSNDVEFKLPVRGTRLSAGYDFFAPINYMIFPGKEILIKTCVKAYMQDDEYLDINIRSSLAIKKNLRLKNVVGIVDADYYSNQDNDGNIMIKLVNEGTENVCIKQGDRVAQGIFKKYLMADNDTFLNEERKSGIGSTNE